MATRDQLLKLLENNPGTYFSGEEIAAGLGVSRTSVWKAVKALQAQGYGIQAVTNRGYCLSPDTDLPDLARITAPLSGFWKPELLDSCPSTNSLLRDRANQGAPEGTVLIAGTQTGGRGRMGRCFFSPPATGIYLSLLLRPQDLNPQQALQLTTMAAAALCLAIEQVTGRRPGIKWVNDLYYRGRKICGILTEASFNLETASLDYAVVGLGLNLYPPREGFPQDLRDIAGALLDKEESGMKNRLISGFLQAFQDLYRSRDLPRAARIYRDRSILPGKQVLVGTTPARVLDITEDCRLLVRYASGEEQALSYGEVTIVNLDKI